MAAKRTIQPPYQTGAEERAAAAGKLYYATIDGEPPCHAIEVRDEAGKVLEVLRRPHHDVTDLAHEVDQRNNGTPLSRRSLGRLGVRGRVQGGRIHAMQSPTEIVVRLVDPRNPTAEYLRQLQASRSKLDRSELPALIAQISNEWKAFADLDGLPLAKRDLREDQLRRLIASVGKQLADKYGI